MDLISIIRAIWRRKVAAIPVILLTLFGAFYVLKVKPPVYQASSSLLILAAPGPPTASQIAADPKLKKINPNNPYVSYGNLTVVADSVIELVTSNANQAALIRAGANPGYQLTVSTAVGNPPIIQVTGIGPSAQTAIRTASVVTRTAQKQLYNLQKEQGVNRLYMIKSVELARPSTAQLSASGKLRALIAVLAAGAILLFVVISTTDALARRRNGQLTPADTPGSGPGDVRGRFNPEERRPGYGPQPGGRRPSDPRQTQPARPVSSGRPNDRRY